MAENRIWFSTVQVAFILNTTDRTIRTRAKNHIQDSEMVVLNGKTYELSDLFVSLYRKLSEVIGSYDTEEENSFFCTNARAKRSGWPLPWLPPACCGWQCNPAMCPGWRC